MSNDPSVVFAAVGVVLALGFTLRWVFKPSRPRTGLRTHVDAAEAARTGGLGMLDVVAPKLPRARALQLRNSLADAGIRSSLSRRHDGDVDVLVFHDDVDRARHVIG